jgi:hypothetical protein
MTIIASFKEKDDAVGKATVETDSADTAENLVKRQGLCILPKCATGPNRLEERN